MNDKDFIEAERRRRLELVRFFSCAAKSERERWVVRLFLTNLALSASEHEFQSPPQNDDVDVLYRDARFQVKELTDPNCRRSSEVKQDFKRAERASHLQELLDSPTAYDIVWVDAFPLILDRAKNNQYPQQSRREIDLLFYVTHRHAFVHQEVQKEELSDSGWRSISCLIGKHSIVLIAGKDAPSFLKENCPSN